MVWMQNFIEETEMGRWRSHSPKALTYSRYSVFSIKVQFFVDFIRLCFLSLILATIYDRLMIKYGFWSLKNLDFFSFPSSCPIIAKSKRNPAVERFLVAESVNQASFRKRSQTKTMIKGQAIIRQLSHFLHKTRVKE